MKLPLISSGGLNAGSFRHGFIMMALAWSASWTQPTSPAVYKIVPEGSRLELAVSRSGFLKVAGHDHAIAARSFSGEVRFNSLNLEDSSVSLSIESASLIVLVEHGVTEKDRKEVQTTMEGAEVLNIKEFPKILFRSTKVSDVSKTGEDFQLTGRLNLHGLEKEIAFPVHIHPENNLLRATGTVTIVQTDFGMKPVKAALGMIRVKDQVKISFDILAERANP